MRLEFENRWYTSSELRILFPVLNDRPNLFNLWKKLVNTDNNIRLYRCYEPHDLVRRMLEGEKILMLDFIEEKHTRLSK